MDRLSSHITNYLKKVGSLKKGWVGDQQLNAVIPTPFTSFEHRYPQFMFIMVLITWSVKIKVTLRKCKYYGRWRIATNYHGSPTQSEHCLLSAFILHAFAYVKQFFIKS